MKIDEDDEGAHSPSANASSPYQELRELGKLGPIQFSWLVERVQRVARANGFPPPSGSVWNDDAAREWLSDQFSGTKGPEFFVRVGITATDDLSYGRLASASIKNALIDQARATAPGLMRKRLRGILSREPGFVDFTSAYAGTPAWSLVGVESIWSGDVHDLLRAPGLPGVGKIQQLNKAGKTSAENIDKLTAAARILIEFAGGALTDQVLATAIVRLFDLDELAPYGLRETDADTQFEARIREVERELDTKLGWNSELEYIAPHEWIEILEEAAKLLRGSIWLERLCIAVADQSRTDPMVLLPGTTVSGQYFESTIAKYRAKIKSLGTSREAQHIVMSRCLEEHQAS